MLFKIFVKNEMDPRRFEICMGKSDIVYGQKSNCHSEGVRGLT